MSIYLFLQKHLMLTYIKDFSLYFKDYLLAQTAIVYQM